MFYSQCCKKSTSFKFQIKHKIDVVCEGAFCWLVKHCILGYDPFSLQSSKTGTKPAPHIPPPHTRTQAQKHKRN
uniref:Uncharacterized protein n=1 Tax=Anguilla anguilla TaxID=7936 RepID=A0A0E9W563_ANGAN